MATQYNSWTEVNDEIKKQQAAQKAADKAANAELHAQQQKQVEATYNASMLDTHKSYVPAYNEAAIQKKITEKQIAENMANLGLTDSGLNRDQQTAVEMSYNKQKNSLDNQRRSAVDSLTRQLASEVSSILQSKLSVDNSIDQSYESAASDYATDIWNKQVEEETKRRKDKYDYDLEMYELKLEQLEKEQQAAREASYIIKTDGAALSRNFTGSLLDNGVSVVTYDEGETFTYVDSNSGKTTTIPRGINPFTGGDMHKDLLSKDEYGNYEYDSSKAFSNGYQPNNINGEKLKKTDDTVDVFGNEQNVWKCGTGYYVWNGRTNSYFQVYKNSNGDWEAYDS